MGLEQSCIILLNKRVTVQPSYGWGWCWINEANNTSLSSVETPPVFHCLIQRFFSFLGELRGFAGIIEESEHIYNGYHIVVSTRIEGTFNFKQNLPFCDLVLGREEPSGTWPEFPLEAIVLRGYGYVGESIETLESFHRKLMD